MHVLLLAAGYGMRLRPLTLLYPKALVPIMNRPLAGFPLVMLRHLGIRRVFMNRHYLADVFPSPEKWKSLTDVQVAYLDEEGFPYGTGGAIHNLIKQMGEDDVLVVNTDGISLASFDRFLEMTGGTDALLYVRPPAGPRYRRMAYDAESGYLDVLSRPPEGQGVMFCGVAWLSKRVLQYLPESYPADWFTDALLPAVRDGARVRGFFDPAPWFDLGNADRFFDTYGALVASYRQNHPGWKTYRAWVEPVFQDLGGGLWGSPDTVVDADVEIIDWTVVGPGCHLGSGSRIRRSVLGEGVRLRRIQVVESFLAGGLELEGFDIERALVFTGDTGLTLMNW